MSGGEAIALGFLKAVGSFAINRIAEQIFAPEPAVDAFVAPPQGLSATAEIDRPQSNYGHPIPLPFGACRLAANLIWAGPYTRKKITQTIIIAQHEDGVQKFYADNEIKYDIQVERDFVDFAVLLCEGEIGGIKKLWFNHVLVMDTDRWGDSRPMYNGQQLNIEFYLGSTTQPASPTIAAIEGATNTPAYRNRAYLVFKAMDITAIGNAIPVIQAEVIGIKSGHQVNAFTDYLPSEIILNQTQTIDTTRNEFYPQYEIRTTVITDQIRDDGNINPLPFASIETDQPGFVFMDELLSRVGLTRDFYNVSQLSKKISGLAVADAGPIRKYVETIMRYCNGVVSETDGKLTFQVNPRLPYLPQYDKNCLISDIGLVVNSLHDVDGRDGYFSSSGGTSEGQFVSIWANCKAYQATGNQVWKDRALFLANALENYLYGRAIPNAPQLFIPHWLFNVKRPFQEETSILNRLLPVTDFGSYLQCMIGPDLHADKIKRIDRAYRKNAAFIWDNREAALVNFSYLGIKRNTDISIQFYQTKDPDEDAILDKTEYVSYSSYSKRAQLDTAELTILDARYDGTNWTIKVAKPSDYTLEVDTEIVIAYTLIEFGEIINVGDRYEAWPNWRKLAKGEIDAAGDSLYWANDAYKELYAITSDSRWLNAYNANKFTLQESHDIDDARQIFKPKPGVNTPYDQPGTFSRSERANFGHFSWKRRPDDGIVYARLSAGEGEVQIGRGVNDKWRSATDTLLVRLRRAPVDPNIVIDNVPPFAPGSYQFNDRIYVWIDTQIVFSESTRYYALIPDYVNSNVTDYTFGLADFMTIFDSLNPTATLPNLSDIKAVGVSVFENIVTPMFGGPTKFHQEGAVTVDYDLEIHLIRPLPEIILPYVPYAAMYTVNMLDNNLVDWRGVPGSGYTYPHVWHDIGVTAGMTTQLSFLQEAQNQYKAYFSAATHGPFIPAFYWDREDARQYGPVNSWGWSWVDPNSQWGGYQYRALQSVCEAAHLTGNATAIDIATKYLTWINTQWTTHTKFPPTDFPKLIKPWAANTEFKAGFYNAVIDIARPTVVNGFVYKPLNTGVTGSTQPSWPTTLYQTVIDGGITWECSGYQYDNAYGNYNEPHMCAMIMRAAIYAKLAGISTAIVNPLITRCYNYLNVNFVSSGEFAGTWSNNGDWWAFWHAEIIGSLSILLLNPAIITELALSSATLNNWLSESNTFITNHTRTL